MMASARSSLQQVIASQIRCTEELLNTLDDEHAALLGRDIERLQTVLPRKQHLSQTLQQLNDKLQGMRTALRSNPEDSTNADGWQSAAAEMGSDWRRLLEITERCDHANRFNGALVYAHEVRLRLAMATLQPSRDMTYGRSGIAAGRFSERLNYSS